ncbi:MAG: NADH-quinone oxidoreductase subunit NuoE family protein [Solirubrobacterales bacterium]
MSEPVRTTDAANVEGRFPEREPEGVPDLSQVEVPVGLRREIERAMKRYPEKRSAAIPALWAVQRKYGWCTPEGIRQAAAVMGVTPAYLESVASFYDLFHLEPYGDHSVLVCTNISCWLRGGDEMLEAFKKAAAESPRDISVRGFECLGACDIAPMASIDERYFGPLDPEDAEAAVEQLRTKKGVLPKKALESRGAAGGKTAPADKRLSRHPLNKPKRSRSAAKRSPQSKTRRSR